MLLFEDFIATSSAIARSQIGLSIDHAGVVVAVCREDGKRLIEPPLGGKYRGE
jgi:hypothetical protein